MEQAKFAEQLTKAKQMVDTAAEEKAIAIAETKRQMHEELEGEEKKTMELREMVKDLTNERDELKSKVEEVEKSGRSNGMMDDGHI